MSASNPAKRAVALRYQSGDNAPIIVASGMGNMAEKIVEVASENGVPIYEDTSLATMLSQMQLGAEVPEELYKLIVDIYVYFLRFDPSNPDKARKMYQKQPDSAQSAEQRTEGVNESK